MKLETYILNDFFEILNNFKIDYCVMNNYKGMPEIIPSDVDFAIEEKSFQKLDYLVLKLANRHNVSITQKIWHGYNKCAYILTPLNTEKYFWLQLDFFVDFCAKGFPNLLPIGYMLKNKQAFKNFYVPKPIIEVPFVLQRRIFKGDLKMSHIHILQNLYSSERNLVHDELLKMFGDELGLLLISVIENNDIDLFNDNLNILRFNLKQISNKNFNINYKLKYGFQQFKRIIYRLLYPTGISMVIIDENLEKQQLLIDRIDEVISGSFHGTLISKPKNLFNYIFLDLIKNYWAKITKRKVYISINNQWKGTSIALLRDMIIIKPDLFFLIKEYHNPNTKQNEKEININKITYLILKKQSERTGKHLFNFLSPTSKKII